VLRVLVINGPNLNTLGWREPELYGQETLSDVEALCMATGEAMDMKVDCFQANGEGEIVERIHAARGVYDGIALNAGAYTHTSIALRDALLGVAIPFVELHLSNTHAREPFRHHSFLADRALGVVSGFGATSYTLAFDGLLQHLRAAAAGS